MEVPACHGIASYATDSLDCINMTAFQKKKKRTTKS